MKVALCFIISYNHSLNKEHIWREWIQPNEDIINVYFHYKSYSKITSTWIKDHAMPLEYIAPTSYYHVVPAYINLLSWGYSQDPENKWFCMLTESCVPIISPSHFRNLFFQNYHYSILRWKKAWWNIHLNNRANLRFLTEEFHLGNDPWFVLKREDAYPCIKYASSNNVLFQRVCKGGLANESIFAIILHGLKLLNDVKNEISHATDWDKMSSPTSPYVFKHGTQEDIEFIDTFLTKHKYTMFLRKVDVGFPDKIIKDYLNRPGPSSWSFHSILQLFDMNIMNLTIKNKIPTLFILIKKALAFLFFIFIGMIHYMYYECLYPFTPLYKKD